MQKKWLKNVVFVLQQADLREPTEIEVIQRHLAGHGDAETGLRAADLRGLRAEGAARRTTGVDKERLWKESGFGPLEEQINRIVTESGARMLKLRSALRRPRS